MGLFSDLSTWQLIATTLVLTHITIAAVTIFLHRAQSHKAVELAPFTSHFFRVWLWLTTGMVTREWVAIHRKHHAKCETEEDPHSPQVKGIHTVMWLGAFLYHKEAMNQETIERYGKNTPNDWIEQNVYSKYPLLGILIMLLIDVVCFGIAGLVIWVIQMIWIPFWAAGVINGIGHFIGYRNWNTQDASRNISPIGILIGGEELHNNHHAFATSAKLSSKSYEFDIGWLYIRLLEMIGQAKVRKVAPTIHINTDKSQADLDTVSTVLGNRIQVLSHFAQQVVRPVVKAEATHTLYSKKSQLMHHLQANSQQLDRNARERLQKALENSQALQTVHHFQQSLHQLWEQTSQPQEARLKALQEWISHAEQSNIAMLEQFAQKLRGYTVQH